MAEYLIQGETLTNIGNSVRSLDGTTANLYSEQMSTNLDTFNTELGAVISEQDDLITQIIAALEAKTGS